MDIPPRNRSNLFGHIGDGDDIYKENDWDNETSYNTTQDEKSSELLWAVLASYLPTDERSLQKLFVHHAEYSLSQTHQSIKNNAKIAFSALALSVRDHLIERWKDTDIFFNQQNVKRVNYLSLEFLLGRTLTNAMSNLNVTENYKRGLYNLGINMEELYEQEADAGLGNGGLGRLAACFMDSLASMNYPGWGYGLRYTYGMFEQKINNGYQIELPDYWLIGGHPWEIERSDIVYPVRFYGHVIEKKDENGEIKYSQEGGEIILAVAYDLPIPGYNTFNTLNLRLWSSKPSHEFNLEQFNQGDYFRAVEQKQRSETLCSVLYPNDNTYIGKELRLKQQFFFVSATLQDILARFKQLNMPLSQFPQKMAIQLNDTHPTLGIPELMRILMDEENLDWDSAWKIVTETFAYTNHTVMPEALERWNVSLMEKLLPRQMKIIYDINAKFLKLVENRWPDDVSKLNQLSIIEEYPEKKVRMAHLAIVGSHKINGVAAIHSELLKTDVFPLFYELFPEKFTNVTNGVTPRRWIQQSNPGLSRLITKTFKSESWLSNLENLKNLNSFATDPQFQEKWRKIKTKNKRKLAKYIFEKLNIRVSENALFDVQIKRFHEYKRQLLNILGVIYRYRKLKGLSDEEKADVVPRVFIYGGKAAPGYYIAKLIIKLINTVAEVVNNDMDTSDLLKIVFLPNYCVSLAEIIIPASDLSEHISTAGHEASGTSNMKFAMNGSLIIGTLDGANIEIMEEIGEENIFIFGAKTEDVPRLRSEMSSGKLKVDPRWNEVLDLLKSGTVGTFDELSILLNTITNGNDHYLLSADFGAYLDAQDRVDETYKNQSKWTEMCIRSVAGTGKFSSDRSIRDYAENIWNLQPCPRPGPVPIEIDKLAEQGLLPENTYDISLSTSPSDVALERLSPYYSETIKSFSPKI